MAKLIDITGKAISGEWGNDDETGQGISVLRTTNFTNLGVINFSNVVTRDIKKTTISDKFLRKGDIIIEKSGGSDKQPVGRVVYFEAEENKYLFNNFTGVLRILDNSICYSKYLFYALFSNYQKGGTIPYQNKTTGLHNLKMDDYVRKCDIPLPSLEEQKKIASNLDKVTYTINLCNQIIEKLDLLVKAKFVEMFGEIGADKFGLGLDKMGDVSEINPKKAKDNRLNSDLEVSFIPMTAVSEKGDINISEIRKYDEVKTGFTYFAENDILFAKITPCMENGKGCIAHNLYNGIGFGSTEFHVLRPLERINPYWLYTITIFEQFRKDAFANMTGSAGQRRVPARFLENFKISVPPIELQNQFADFVKQTEKSKSAVKQVLEKAETLKKALMQEYFG